MGYHTNNSNINIRISQKQEENAHAYEHIYMITTIEIVFALLVVLVKAG